MTDWFSLVSNAAQGASPERGANARSAAEIFSDAVQAVITDDHLAAFYSAARAIIGGEQGHLAEEFEALRLRCLADAVVTLHGRQLGHSSENQLRLLEEVCWGRFNQLWKPVEVAPRVPFQPRDASAIYIRAILREFGSAITATETAGVSSIFGADPMVMLDLLERDDNVSRFLSVLLTYSHHGWLHPADILLRFDRWNSLLLKVSASDIGYRTALSLVGQADNMAYAREKLALLLLNAITQLLEQTAHIFADHEGIYNGRPSAEAIKELAAARFGPKALSRALEDRQLEATGLAKTQESNVVRYLEHLGQDAQEMSDEWCARLQPDSSITDILCRVLHVKARPKPMELRGATQTQLINFYG